MSRVTPACELCSSSSEDKNSVLYQCCSSQTALDRHRGNTGSRCESCSSGQCCHKSAATCCTNVNPALGRNGETFAAGEGDKPIIETNSRPKSMSIET